jgi:hypothetical protein
MKRVLILLLCLTLPTAWAEPTSAVIVKALNAEKEWDSDLEKCPADLFVPADRQAYHSEVRRRKSCFSVPASWALHRDVPTGPPRC